MPILWILFFLLASLGFVETFRLWWFVSREKRPLEKFERLNPDAAVHILFVGDSTGWGNGTSDPRYSVPGRIAADFPAVHLENESRGGRRLRQIASILENRLKSLPAPAFDLVVVMVGGADVTYFTPLWTIPATLRRVIALARRSGREVLVVSPSNAGLAPLYAFPLSWIYTCRARKIKRYYEAVCEEMRVPHTSLFVEADDPVVLGGHFSRDKTHPNDEGYRLWYEHLKSDIRSLLSR